VSIEIKLTNAPKVPRGFSNLSDDFNVEKRLILTPSSDEYKMTENTTVISLKGFLEKLGLIIEK